MRPSRFFNPIRIRYKLFIAYASVFVLTIAASGLVTYSVVRGSIETHIERELGRSTAGVVDLVRTAVSVSIRNHLRAAAEKNREMVAYFHRQYQEGRLSEAEAKREAGALLLSQRIGTTGYMACVDSRGVMVLHPEPSLIGDDISGHGFVREMIARKEGYIEYDWKNPGETAARPKALYMTYFAPWDWIINVSSYRREFSTLLDIDDFRDRIRDQRFGPNGYAFVVDGAGTPIVHPELPDGERNGQPVMPEALLRSLLDRKDGHLVYTEPDSGIGGTSRRFVSFGYIPEYDWIVASLSDLDAFDRPLRELKTVVLLTTLATLVLALSLSFGIGASITRPLGNLIDRLGRAAVGGDRLGVTRPSGDEVAHLTAYFDAFMERLAEYHSSLKGEIAERRQAEAALRDSEARYRSVMEAAPDPIIVYDTAGRVSYLNPAFTRVFGWTVDASRGRRMDHFLPAESWEAAERYFDSKAANGALPGVETRRFAKDGSRINVSVRGAIYRDADGQPGGVVIVHRDVTDLKRLEKEVMDIGDRERQRIGQDLHDDLCPHLIGIEGLTRVLQGKVAAADPDAGRLASQVAELIREAITKTRHLARGLCPVYLVDHGLESALRELAQKTESISRVACAFTCASPVAVADHLKATQLFRIAQEAVNNAVRHGRAGRIDIRLEARDGGVGLTIADDGCGMPIPVSSDGMGLRIMGFRAKMIDAALDIRSERGRGTVVQVTFETGRPTSNTEPVSGG